MSGNTAEIKSLLDQIDACKLDNEKLEAEINNSTKLPLQVVGFCGADDSVDPRLLVAVSEQYPWVEWGVLFREDLQGQPRYASLEWLEDLRTVIPGTKVKLAGHLCGKYCEQVLAGDGTFVKKLHSYGFRRVQVNATAANNVDTSGFTEKVKLLRKAICDVPEIEFIVQKNDQTRELWEALVADPPANLSLLYDESMGLGKLTTSWPEPLPNVKFGFAGGLGPANLADQLEKMAKAVGGRSLWIDMESGLRSQIVVKEGEGSTTKDIFDINKCMTCILAAKAHL
jgi:hypothetical protein